MKRVSTMATDSDTSALHHLFTLVTPQLRTSLILFFLLSIPVSALPRVPEDSDLGTQCLDLEIADSHSLCCNTTF